MYLVLPKAGLSTSSLEEAKAYAERKAKETKSEQVILQATVIVAPRLDVETRPFSEAST